MTAKPNRKITKCVIPVAGLGSRFLPATKAVPKELLPIIDKPIIHFIVQEAVSAGIETVVFVTSRPKVLIEDYFDPGDLTRFRLMEAKKEHLIEEVLRLSEKIDIVSVRQYEPRGLGHAILQAAPIVEGQSFAVILGDDLIVGDGSSAIAQCAQMFNEKDEGSVIGVLRVPREESDKYGMVAVDDSQRITRFVEKPAPAETPSDLAMPGRYVFEAHIIEALRKVGPGKNGEIQLTDAMDLIVKDRPFFAKEIAGERFDTGDKLGYIMANVAFALRDPLYKDPLRAWLNARLGT